MVHLKGFLVAVEAAPRSLLFPLSLSLSLVTPLAQLPAVKFFTRPPNTCAPRMRFLNLDYRSSFLSASATLRENLLVLAGGETTRRLIHNLNSMIRLRRTPATLPIPFLSGTSVNSDASCKKRVKGGDMRAPRISPRHVQAC
ncbi:MAG: hypothetical protein JWM99_115 [Verrucomicrobiales bacterium]|nr:hypothetical protein [Verrucomicrobiales bacterium]